MCLQSKVILLSVNFSYDIKHKLLFEISETYKVALITATHDNNFIKNFDKIYKLEDNKLTEA